MINNEKTLLKKYRKNKNQKNAQNVPQLLMILKNRSVDFQRNIFADHVKKMENQAENNNERDRHQRDKSLGRFGLEISGHAKKEINDRNRHINPPVFQSIFRKIGPFSFPAELDRCRKDKPDQGNLQNRVDQKEDLRPARRQKITEHGKNEERQSDVSGNPELGRILREIVRRKTDQQVTDKIRQYFKPPNLEVDECKNQHDHQ